MDLKSRLEAASTAKPVLEAGVFFFVDIRYDAAGQPTEAHAFANDEASRFETTGLSAEYESVDAQNVCCLFLSALMRITQMHGGRSSESLI